MRVLPRHTEPPWKLKEGAKDNKPMKDKLLQIFGIVEDISKVIALLLAVLLLCAACLILLDTTKALVSMDLKVAIQDGLFVLILLEMFYVIRSFIKYNSINVGLIINIGVIATIKQLVFQLESLTLELALSFSTIILSLGVTYLLEVMHFSRKKDQQSTEEMLKANLKS
jgi:uncharacterized membrane protein (DUF373 family)